MSSTIQTGPLDWSDRFSDDIEAAELHHDGRQGQIHTSMPGVIVSYDPAKMTAVVQPALQVFHTQIDGTRVPTTLTTISDVPVHFPGGGGHMLTFPVKAGDECWLVFSERSIDNWFQHGGVQQPSDWRMHDINDPVCHVGVRSQPNVPAGGLNPNAVELRSDDGATVVRVDGVNHALTLIGQTVTVNAPVVTIAGPGGGKATVNVTGDIVASGTITADTINAPHGHVGP